MEKNIYVIIQSNKKLFKFSPELPYLCVLGIKNYASKLYSICILGNWSIDSIAYIFCSINSIEKANIYYFYVVAF